VDKKCVTLPRIVPELLFFEASSKNSNHVFLRHAIGVAKAIFYKICGAFCYNTPLFFAPNHPKQRPT
jgi:hypothetical protein